MLNGQRKKLKKDTLKDQTIESDGGKSVPSVLPDFVNVALRYARIS